VRGVAPGDALHLRAGPYPAAPPLGELSAGERCITTLAVEAPREELGWQAVELADGSRGWVSSRFIAPDPDCDPAGP
jgi:hypothetical protein